MIRTATLSDAGAITEIYNQAIQAGFQTGYTVPFTEKEGREWVQAHLQPIYPLLVHDNTGLVEGWVSITPYRQGRGALSGTVEVSYYVHQSSLRRGIGIALLDAAVARSKALGYSTVIAIILDVNMPSIALVERCGFSRWGHLPGVASYNGVKCGHVYYGLSL